MTGLLVAVIVVIFVLEEVLGTEPASGQFSPALSTLVALGGLSKALVEHGDWWRFLTAPFLHAGILHVLFNACTLGVAGAVLERSAGRAWMLCIFLFGAFAGTLGSLAFNTPSTVTVGASGGIMALVAAMFMMSFHFPQGAAKSQMQRWAASVGVASLIPSTHSVGSLIDYGAHAGGAAFGILAGLVLLVAWRGGAMFPSGQAVAAGLAGLAVAGVCIGGTMVARAYPSYASLGPLIPAETYSKAVDQNSMAPQLLQTYPDDPRASFLMAMNLLDQPNSAAQAEDMMRQAVTKLEAQSWRFKPFLLTTYQAELALFASDAGRAEEAKNRAHQACAVTGEAALDPKMRAIMEKYNLCDKAG